MKVESRGLRQEQRQAAVTVWQPARLCNCLSLSFVDSPASSACGRERNREEEREGDAQRVGVELPLLPSSYTYPTLSLLYVYFTSSTSTSTFLPAHTTCTLLYSLPLHHFLFKCNDFSAALAVPTPSSLFFAHRPCRKTQASLELITLNPSKALIMAKLFR